MGIEQNVAAYYTRGMLQEKILRALQSAGKNLGQVRPDDFAALDNFHVGGREATEALAGFMDPRAGMHKDFDFSALLSEESGRPVLFNAIAVNDKLPYIYRAQLRWLAEANKQGKPVFGQVATARAANYITFEDWNLYDSNPNWREATTGTVEEKKVKLADPRI